MASTFKFDEKYKSIYKRNNKCQEQETRKNDDTGKRRYLKPIVKSSKGKRQGY